MFRRSIVGLALVCLFAPLSIVGCTNARPAAQPSRSQRSFPATKAVLAPPESMYTTSVALSRAPSVDASLTMQRLSGDQHGQSQFYADLAITFDSHNTYWDPNGYILAAVTATGHVDLQHGAPGVGKTAPRMLNPTTVTMWGFMPSNTAEIRLIAFAGATKQAARTGKQFVVPIDAIPTVRKLAHPTPRF
jgi:hypothetical protein